MIEDQSDGMAQYTHGSSPMVRVLWPSPLRSMAKITSPGPNRSIVSLPMPTSTCPDGVKILRWQPAGRLPAA